MVNTKSPWYMPESERPIVVEELAVAEIPNSDEVIFQFNNQEDLERFRSIREEIELAAKEKRNLMEEKEVEFYANQNLYNTYRTAAKIYIPATDKLVVNQDVPTGYFRVVHPLKDKFFERPMS
jgi:glycerophosphoryl diester phosphodiesterase